jgi:hypothetical protein
MIRAVVNFLLKMFSVCAKFIVNERYLNEPWLKCLELRSVMFLTFSIRNSSITLPHNLIY